MQHNRPVLFVVINNGGYGMVRWGHLLQFGRALPGFDYPAPDIAKMAEGMGATSLRIRNPDQWDPLWIALAFAGSGPAVAEVVVSPADVPPMQDRVNTLRGG